MENPQNLELRKSTGKDIGVEIRIHESKAKTSDITSSPLPSKEGGENVRQANRELGESADLVSKERKEIGAKLSEIPERPKSNSVIGSENPQTTLEPTNHNLRPEYNELETDKRQEVASESWVKKAWGKVAFYSPDNLYFKPSIIEKWGNGRIYELLGVKPFKRYYDREYSKPISYSSFALKIKDRKLALKEFEKRTRRLEISHVVWVPIYGLLSAYAFHIGIPILGNALGYMITAFNFAYNFYPIITQRYNRVKVYNLIDQLNARERKSNK